MNIKFLGCWVFGGPAIIAFGFTAKIVTSVFGKFIPKKLISAWIPKYKYSYW